MHSGNELLICFSFGLNLFIMLSMNLQEPVSHVVARPSPNDILEWRKLHLSLSLCFLLQLNFPFRETEPFLDKAIL